MNKLMPDRINVSLYISHLIGKGGLSHEQGFFHNPSKFVSF
jgi:hypothetical protein